MLPRAVRSCSRPPATRETQIPAQGLPLRPSELYTLGASALARRWGGGSPVGPPCGQSRRAPACKDPAVRLVEDAPGDTCVLPAGRALRCGMGGVHSPASGRRPLGTRTSRWDRTGLWTPLSDVGQFGAQEPALRREATSPGREVAKSEASALLVGMQDGEAVGPSMEAPQKVKKRTAV